MGKIKDFIQDSKRIIKVSKKPNKDEYSTMIKITGIGIVIIGVIGFIIFLLFQVFGLGL